MRKIYSLRYNESLSLHRIQSDLQLPDIIALRIEIQYKLRDFFNKYNIQPLNLFFSVSSNEYLLKIDHSYVGNIIFRNFIIKILPKHMNISTEKILKLTSFIDEKRNIIFSNSYFEDFIGNDDSVSALDFFYHLFVENVKLCIRNGLVNGFVEKKNTSENFRGRLDINKFIIYPIPSNYVHQIIKLRTPDIKINRLIKTITSEILSKSKSSELTIESKSILRSLAGVNLLKIPAFFVKEDFYINNMQRKDYKSMLELAEIIINGFDPDHSENIGFIPEYIIDFDIAFERICFSYLKKTLNSMYFQVLYQSKHSHIFSELELSGKIIPDIYITASDDSHFKNKNMILDAKNKVSGLDSSFKVNTADIYQLMYYSKILMSKFVVLLYPGTQRNASRYILKGSQGDIEYKKSCLIRLKNLYDHKQIVECNGTIFILWRVNLEGTLKDTQNSFNELSNFLIEIMNDDVMILSILGGA